MSPIASLLSLFALSLTSCGITDRWQTVDELRNYADNKHRDLRESMGINPLHFSRLFGRLEAEHAGNPERFLLLPGVASLTESEAEVIHTWRGSLISLPQLKDPSPAVLHQIVTSGGSDLCLAGMSDLNLAQAQEIVAWAPEGRIFLTGPQSITSEVARELSQWGTQDTESLLVLDGLTGLSPEAAQLLMHGKAWALSLNGLTEMDAALSKSFEAHGRPTLRLSGLKTIPEAARSSFALWTVKFLWLGGIEELDLATAQCIAGSSNTMIFMDAVRELELDVAKVLMTAKPSHISLLGLRSLSAEVKQLLSSKRNSLSFNTGVL